jgi:hypothetical protein
MVLLVPGDFSVCATWFRCSCFRVCWEEGVHIACMVEKCLGCVVAFGGFGAARY